MGLLDRLFKKEKQTEEPSLQENTVSYRTSIVEKYLEEEKTIFCNGKEFPIKWDKVIRFDQEGGFKYDKTHYREKSSRKPKMVVVHWDACLNTEQMVRVTKERGLSVHFGIDEDGTIYQMLDTKEIAYHAKGINTVSVGIEIANPVVLKYNKEYYEKTGRENRPIIEDDVLHGNKLEPYLGFYPVQIEALKALLKSLTQALDIPVKVPVGDDGKLLKKVVTSVQNSTFKGIVGHYHSTNKKRDPGYLDLVKIAKEIED